MENIKINVDKSIYIPFSLNKKISPAQIFQGAPIPLQLHVKYLGIVLDKILTWGLHFKAKR
jgi:hypothetical protein